jgi:hypothetical protein
MTDQNLTHIAFLLDRSGSMEEIRKDAIGGFNTLLADQQAEPGQCTFTLVQFDSQGPAEVVHNMVPIQDVPPLTVNTFKPRGGTPLLDAMGHLIAYTGEKLAAMPEDRRPGKVIFAVLTDGLKNASRLHTRRQVFEMVTHQREVYQWQFMFLGVDQDAIAEARSYGIAGELAMSIAKTSRGTRRAFSMSSKAISKMRLAKSKQQLLDASFSAEDRAEQAEEIKKQKSGSR